MRRTVIGAALVAVLAAACPVLGQTPDRFTADVLVKQEGLGPVRISPDGRWVSVDVSGRYDAAPTYVFAQYNSVLLSRLQLYDTAHRTIRHVLQDPTHNAGFTGGPFSPDGQRMIVYKLTRDAWTLGVLTLETGVVDWTDITPEETQFGRTVRWLSPTEVLITAHPENDLPLAFRVGGHAQTRTVDLWDATASGRRVGATYIPSGALRDTRTQQAPLELTLLDVARGTQRVLAQGAIYDFIPSPNGQRLAVFEEREDLQPDPGAPVRVGDPMRRRALRMIDIHTGEISLDRSLDYAPYFAAWRPDGEALLAFARPTGSGDFDQSGTYFVVDYNGRVEPVLQDRQKPAIERSLWGEPVALGGWNDGVPVLRVFDETAAPRWRSPDGSVDVEALRGDRLLAWGQRLRLYRNSRMLSLTLDEVGSGTLAGRGEGRDGGNRTSWTPDTDAFWGLRAGTCIHGQSLAQETCFAPLKPGESVVAASSSVLASREDRADGASAINIRFPDAIETIATVNTDRAELSWGDLIEVPHQGPAGEALKSWLLLPPGLKPGVRAPVVLEVYVGRVSATEPSILKRGSTRLQNNPSVLAAGGYAVLMVSLPNPPGGQYSGPELATRLLDIVDRAATGGRIDGQRVALLGHSYGGFNVLSAAPHSPRFAAVIASNGAADLSTTLILPPFYRTAPEEGVPVGTSIGWSETGQAATGRFPAEASRYIDRSPLYEVEKLTVPALLIESDMDRPRYGSLFGALYRLDREAAWLNYFGEGHTIVSPANVRDLHTRILDWLGRYLAPPVGDAALPMAGPGLQHSREEGRVDAFFPEQP